MDIFALGLHTLIISELKELGIKVVTLHTLPDPKMIGDQCLIVTSEAVDPNQLSDIRQKYPMSTIMYQHLNVSVRGYQHIQAICLQDNIHFLSPRATKHTILDKLKMINSGPESQGNIIGLFGSGHGVGVTTIGHTLAKYISAQSKKVVYLGLDLFDPGYSYSYKPKISLDQLRSRLKGKVLKNEDFESLMKLDGYYYLPGNFDFLAPSDYQEEEIEELLYKASGFADVVIADFGSVLESAAYYVGTQRSNIRFFVTHYSHEYRLSQIMQALNHLDINANDFMMIVNRSDVNDTIPPKRLAGLHGMLFGHDFPYYPSINTHLPLGRKDADRLVRFIHSILLTIKSERDAVVDEL